jgi:hypothetical protein
MSAVFVSELKFLISLERAGEIRQWAMDHLPRDPHADSGGGYRVSSLYFDTADRAVYHRRGSYAKTKYRIRRYGAESTAFLERKLRTRGRVGKIRTLVPLTEWTRVGEPEPDPSWDGYWFQRRLRVRSLEPVCQITYERWAFGVTGTRLTIDRNLRAVPAGEAGFEEGGREFCQEQAILELKFSAAMNGVFKQLLGRFPLTSVSVSKYRMATEQCLTF